MYRRLIARFTFQGAKAAERDRIAAAQLGIDEGMPGSRSAKAGTDHSASVRRRRSWGYWQETPCDFSSVEDRAAADVAEEVKVPSQIMQAMPGGPPLNVDRVM